ncbi:hypothetical protein DYI95_004215 [Thermaerobacter sp. PB12/4term]|uniref:hypothetical protein n=1 Tax=Thermaerobacter sp. PB12/4term TaxID=2293838 RepID=UPI000E32BA20|nr:hypothetical protein [Thermaerobacter sp. PB12/4term]QIA26826.1 hypothetical protein DYI95_004215 [Thermaerobacter sp. PB12/4term]
MGLGRRQAVAATLVAVAILGGVAAGAYWWRLDAGRDEPAPAARKPAPPVRATTLTAETRLVERTRYPACRGVVLETERPPTALEAGWHVADLLRSRDTWRLVEATPDRVVLEREVREPCPPQAWLRYRTVGLHQGRVAVFYGRPDDKGDGLGPLRLLTTVPEERLLPGDRRRLERGMVVEGEAEAWHVLESLTP